MGPLLRGRFALFLTALAVPPAKSLVATSDGVDEDRGAPSPVLVAQAQDYNITHEGGIVSVVRWHSDPHADLDLIDHALRFAALVGAGSLHLPQGVRERVGEQWETDQRDVPVRDAARMMVQVRKGRHGQRQLPIPRSLFASFWQGGHFRVHGGTVRVQWGGRLGNCIYGASSALVFATRFGANTIHWDWNSDILQILNLPRTTTMPGVPQEDLHKFCTHPALQGEWDATGHNVQQKFWYWHCHQVPVARSHGLLVKYIAPHMTQALARCVSKPYNEAEERTLSVHLRCGDAVDVSSPCSLIERVRREGHFERVKIVSQAPGTDGDRGHPCRPVYERMASESPDSDVSFQNGNVVSDACAIIRARHLLVSVSTFAESLTLLSTGNKTLYHAGTWALRAGDALRWCASGPAGELWPGVRVQEYDLGRYDVMPESEKIKHVTTWPVDKCWQKEPEACD